MKFTVSEQDRGERLDRFVIRRTSGVGRKYVLELIAQGQVRVDGRKRPKSHALSTGEEVEIELGAGGHALAAPHIPLTILKLTNDYVIVDKPAGIPCTALPGRERDTLAGALLARFPEMREVGFGAREPGLVHRLDVFTSGVLLAARSPESFAFLRARLEAHEIEKRYLAVVSSRDIDERGVIEASLAPDHKNARCVRLLPPGSSEGHPSHTSYRVLLRGEQFALVEARAASAYRHQIRAHLAGRGSPLLGDTLYGGEDAGLAPRHALHASLLAWEAWPQSGSGAEGEGTLAEALRVTAPLPEDLQGILLADGIRREQLEDVVGSIECTSSSSR